MEWALDHGFEYIEIDQNNIIDTWNEREKDGLPRLMEALQSNMWSNMNRNDASFKVSASSTSTTNINNSSYYSESESLLNDKEKNIPETVFNNIKDFNNNNYVSSNINDTSINISNLEKLSSIIIESTSNINITDENKSLLDDDDDNNINISDKEGDKIFSQFAEIIEQAKSLRNRAEIGQITDAERREKAAHIAMKFAMAMNLDDDNYDNSDDDEN